VESPGYRLGLSGTRGKVSGVAGSRGVHTNDSVGAKEHWVNGLG